MNAASINETQPEVLVIMVSYCTDELIVRHVEHFVAGPIPDGVTLAIADNSPESSLSCQRRAHSSRERLRYFHYSDNPLYLGAAKRVLEDLASELDSPLPYHAVVLCNADLDFDYFDLTKTVRAARAHTGDWRWILAPKIVEAGRNYHPNPHLMSPPGSNDRRMVMRWYPSWFLYRWLYRWRRRLSTNKHAANAPFTTMYSAYGAFVVFGCGFFMAGGVFHDGPLFGEEHGIAEQARQLGVSTLYVPMLIIDHAVEASTSTRRVGARQRFEWQKTSQGFYASWDASAVSGTMAATFEPG